MDLNQKREIGKTGLMAGRLGLGAGYGAPAAAFEEAFKRGCNYFYWTSRKSGMRDAIRQICANGKRDELVIALQTYSRSAFLMETSMQKALKKLSIDHADVLLLGWYNRKPAARLIDKALSMKEKGYFRFLGMSGHNRPLFPKMVREGVFDLFQVRYNAAHRGAETDVFPLLRDNGQPGIVSYTATRWGHLLRSKKMPPGEAPPSAADCYRFVLTYPDVDVALCGPKNVNEMREALKTLDMGPMDDAELNRMKKIGDHVHASSSTFF